MELGRTGILYIGLNTLAMGHMVPTSQLHCCDTNGAVYYQYE